MLLLAKLSDEELVDEGNFEELGGALLANGHSMFL